MKKYLVFLLVGMSGLTWSNDRLNPQNAASLIVKDLKIRVKNVNGSYYLNNKPILFDFDIWERRLQNTFENCDEYSLYVDSLDSKKDCYVSVVNGYESWLESTQDQNISMRTWRAAASEGTYGNTVDFNHWVSMIRVYGSKNGDGVKKPVMPEDIKQELNSYKQELSAVNAEAQKEYFRGVFRNNKKLDGLYIKQAELRDKINAISIKYSLE
jgi:hypothetical protein